MGNPHCGRFLFCGVDTLFFPQGQDGELQEWRSSRFLLQKTNRGCGNVRLKDHRTNVRIGETDLEIGRHMAQCSSCSLDFKECVIIGVKRNDGYC